MRTLVKRYTKQVFSRSEDHQRVAVGDEWR